MNKKLENVRARIKSAEEKVKELQDYIKTLRARERQLMDEELVAKIRKLSGKEDPMKILEIIEKEKNHKEEKLDA